MLLHDVQLVTKQLSMYMEGQGQEGAGQEGAGTGRGRDRKRAGQEEGGTGRGRDRKGQGAGVINELNGPLPDGE